ncbi:MAG: hypothetical protein ACHQM6_02330, partial [Candidatus Kapaibacterium sp.]
MQPIVLDSCAQLKLWEEVKPANQEESRQQYDTLKLYIEKCAAIDSTSWQAFSHLEGAVAGFPPADTTRYDRYRDWLISVLYLNTTTPEYFCACLGSIGNTYGALSSEYKIRNAGLAVAKYLLGISVCTTKADELDYQKNIDYLKNKGLDTTLPPLDSIGLGFLLHHNGVSKPGGSLSSEYLVSFTSSPNPFVKETTLEFTLNRMSYV